MQVAEINRKRLHSAWACDVRQIRHEGLLEETFEQRPNEQELRVLSILERKPLWIETEETAQDYS